MSTNKKPLPAEPQDNAANDGVAAELSDEAIRNLTGFFDVLIQMDFAQKQRNERNDEDGNDLQNTASVAA
jgi:cytochrome c553